MARVQKARRNHARAAEIAGVGARMGTQRRPSQVAQPDLERARRQGHRPGQYTLAGGVGLPAVQRLVHASKTAKLYTSDGWQDLGESIEVPNNDGEGTTEVMKKISDYSDSTAFKGEIGERWGIDLWSTGVETWSKAKNAIQEAVWKKSKAEFHDEFKDRFADPDSSNTKSALANIAIGNVNEVENLGDQLNGGVDQQGLIDAVRARYREYSRQAKGLRSRVREDYFLYQTTEVGAVIGRNAVMPERRAVLNPVVYMEADEGSSIVEDMNRLHACVLLATIYERGLDSTSKEEARQQVKDHLANVKPDTDLGSDLSIQLSHFSSKRVLEKSKLYAAAEKLHGYFKGEKGINYDLDKNNEEVMELSGYRLIFAGNTTWNDLPRALPIGMTLAPGLYIFMISKKKEESEGFEGHSNTVRVLQAIDKRTEIEMRRDYFTVTNETSNNFNKDPFSFRIRSIWQRQ